MNLLDPTPEDQQAARDWEIENGLRSRKDRFKPDLTPREKIELLIIAKGYTPTPAEQEALDTSD